MRQKQAAKAKLVATHVKQREVIRKEQEKLRAAKAAEKQANANRLKTPPPGSTTSKDTLPVPSETTEADPEILPNAGNTTNKVNTPKGGVVEVSRGYTLSEEGEGDNISGNKELRGEGEHEDETNSKRPKVPLHPPVAE